MPFFKRLRGRREKLEVSHAASSTPVDLSIPGSSNTLSSGQQLRIGPLSNTQQTTQTQPQSIGDDSAEVLGLRPIHIPIISSDDDEDRVRAAVDIIAIHGITGNAYDTWTHGNGTFWLRDLLPKDLPGVRVFSFGYPADVFCTFATGTIDEFARSLLESLKRTRRNKDVRTLFIC